MAHRKRFTVGASVPSYEKSRRPSQLTVPPLRHRRVTPILPRPSFPSPVSNPMNSTLLAFMISHKEELRTLSTSRFASFAGEALARTTQMSASVLAARAQVMFERYRAVEAGLPRNHGADEVRAANVQFVFFSTMYELFNAPLPQSKPVTEDSIIGKRQGQEVTGRNSMVVEEELVLSSQGVACDSATPAKDVNEFNKDEARSREEASREVCPALMHFSSAGREGAYSTAKQPTRKRPRFFLAGYEAENSGPDKEEEELLRMERAVQIAEFEARRVEAEIRATDAKATAVWREEERIVNARSKMLSDLRESAVVLNTLEMTEEATAVMKRVIRILDQVEGFER